jgi:hypothetical protein
VTARPTLIHEPIHESIHETLGPIVPLRDRCLPVDEALAPLLPDGGLRRGHVVGCSGPAAVSLAVGVAARAVVAGSWLAVVGMPSIGVEAVDATGIPLERVVAIDAGSGPREWSERVAAAVDGFELVLTRPPAGAERTVRRVGQRLQARGAVLLPVGPSSPGVACDVELVTTPIAWSGIGQGVGHLAARRVRVVAGGRRVPRPVDVELWLPGSDGRVASVTPVDDDHADLPGRVDDLRRAG